MALVDESGQAVVDTAQGHAHGAAELPLGPVGVFGQKLKKLEAYVIVFRQWMGVRFGLGDIAPPRGLQKAF